MKAFEEIKGNVFAIALTGLISTVGNVLAMQVHIDYIKKGLARIEASNERQDLLIRDLELSQAILSNIRQNAGRNAGGEK